MLKKRIITAAILIPLVIFGLLYLPPMVISIIVAFFMLLAAGEFFNLFGWKAYDYRYVIFAITLILLTIFIEYVRLVTPPSVFYSFCGGGLLILAIIGALWWLVAPCFLYRYEKYGRIFSINPVLLAMLTLAPCWASLLLLNTKPNMVLCYLLSMIWAADIGAYFSGKFFGKHLLVPNISPKKTVEGVIGGTIAVWLVTIVFLLSYTNRAALEFNVIAFHLILSTIVSLWAVIGDLFESMLKRQAGIKDSGRLLPGHGGVYDRIDSLIAAAPIFVVGCLLFTLTDLLHT